jgi:hypothetical protein
MGLSSECVCYIGPCIERSLSCSRHRPNDVFALTDARPVTQKPVAARTRDRMEIANVPMSRASGPTLLAFAALLLVACAGDDTANPVPVDSGADAGGARDGASDAPSDATASDAPADHATDAPSGDAENADATDAPAADSAVGDATILDGPDDADAALNPADSGSDAATE